MCFIFLSSTCLFLKRIFRLFFFLSASRFHFKTCVKSISNSCQMYYQFIFMINFYVLFIQWSKLSSTTSQQLDSMQRHAEGYGDLWNKQTASGNETVVSMISTSAMGCSDGGKIANAVTYLDKRKSASSLLLPPLSSSTLATTTIPPPSAGPTTAITTTIQAKATMSSTPTTTVTIKTKPNDWVVIPVFADIIRLAINAREDCLRK